MTSADKPLEGRRVVVTRAAEQASELAGRLEALGAEVLTLPLVEFAPPADPAPLDRALEELESFDWLFFTSQNAVRFFSARARLIGQNLARLLDQTRPRPRVAAVGRATEQAVLEQGWRVDRAASGKGGLDLAHELRKEVRGCRVLLPRSDRASNELPRALAEAGAEPVAVVAYRTLPATTLDAAVLGRIERGEVDVLSFASPSAFSALAARCGEEKFRRVTAVACIAAIGPTTAAAIRRAGLGVAIEAAATNAAGLAAAIASHFARKPVTRGGQK
jgi:uroporphyrinogen-III synthase